MNYDETFYLKHEKLKNYNMTEINPFVAFKSVRTVLKGKYFFHLIGCESLFEKN